MAPKRPKSGAAGGAAVPPGAGSKNWESGLVTARLEEEDWVPSIAFVVGDQVEDELHLKALSLAVQLPLRKLFSVVSWEGILEEIMDAGNVKAKKVKEGQSPTPLYYEGVSFHDPQLTPCQKIFYCYRLTRLPIVAQATPDNTIWFAQSFPGQVKLK